MGVFSEHRLLVAIGLLTTIVGVYEFGNLDPDPDFEREHRSLDALVAVYPDDPRVRFRLALEDLKAGDYERAREMFASVLDSDFKEDESSYAGYIEALMMTSRDRAEIERAVEAWGRNNPTSRRRQSMEARLRKAGMLP